MVIVLSMYGMLDVKVISTIMHESGKIKGGGGGEEEMINDMLVRLRRGLMVVWECKKWSFVIEVTLGCKLILGLLGEVSGFVSLKSVHTQFN